MNAALRDTPSSAKPALTNTRPDAGFPSNTRASSRVIDAFGAAVGFKPSTPIEEGVDVTIRIAALADSSLIARKLAPARIVLVASRDYLAAHGEPSAPSDLAKHNCLNYGHSTTLQRWQLTHDGLPLSIAINSTLCSNNGDVLRAAALAGHGIARLPAFLVGQDVISGRLKSVLASWPPPELGIYALYAPNRYLAAKTRVFIDHLAKIFAK